MTILSFQIILTLVLYTTFTILFYECKRLWKITPYTKKQEINTAYENLSRVTDRFYIYFYMFLGFIVLLKFMVYPFIGESLIVDSIVVGITVFFGYMQLYPIRQWEKMYKKLKK